MKRISPTNGAERRLLIGRYGLSNGDLPRALLAYSHLIQRGRLTEEILPDLARLIKNHPRDHEASQTLGDALASPGCVEHANQSYEQTRKLKV